MDKTRAKSNLLICTCLAVLLFLGQGCGGGSGTSSSTPPPPPPPPPPHSIGANVAENLETAFLYVDGTAGNDNNNGSKNAPFKTIGKALLAAGTNNQNSVGTQININPGVYREQLTFQASQTSLPFTLQAVTPGTVFVSGADSLPGNTWSVSTYGSNIYTNFTTSTYIFPACAAPAGWPPVPPVVSRREMVFVNGARLNQVMFSGELKPGTFWADAGGSNQIYLWPPSGTNMATADVELATASRSPLMGINGVNNFVIRGITFVYDNSCTQQGLRLNNATNVLIDNDQFLWNNSMGFGLYAGAGAIENVTVQNSVANHNGQIGFGGNQVKYVLYQNDQSSYNGWRGALGAFYEVGFDGSYFFRYHNTNFNGYTSYYNESSGVHFDTDNATDQVTGLQSGANNLEGLSIEASEGPFLVQNSAICSNSLDPVSRTGNMNIDDSSSVTLTGNTLYNGAPEQLYILGDGRAGTNWEQPGVPLVRFNQNLTQTGNTFTGTANQLGFSTYYSDTPSCSVPITNRWQTFGGTLSSQSNTWGDSAATDSTYPFFQAAILNATVPLSTWQSPPPQGVGQDTNSQFVPQAPAPQQCAVPKPDIADFWLVLGPRGGAAAIVPEAGGPAIPVPFSLFSLGFTGNVSLSFDATQPGGSPVAGVTGSLSPQTFSLSPGAPLTPVPGTLTVTTTSATPNGFYPLTVTATDGANMTRTATFFLQVGSPSALQLLGSSTIQTGVCARFQIHSVDSSGNPSDVLDSTYLNAAGEGSGQFYQDSSCVTAVSFSPINPGCPAGIEIPKGDYSPHFAGTGSIWFLDPKAETLNITISDEANVLKPAVATIQVK
jgi:hypothetical protein